MRKPVTALRRDQIEDLLLGFLKDSRLFHPNGGQLIDIKKTPVIDFFPSHTPKGQSVGLIGN